MNRSYLIALLCWAFPMLAGVTAFLAWLNSGSMDWWTVGMLVIVTGSVLFVVGVSALIASILKDRRESSVMPRRRWWPNLLCAGLLFSNFPLALVIAGAVFEIETRYTVVVNNDSPLLWEDVHVFGGGIRSATVTLPPGGTTTFEVWPETDGELRLRARSGERGHSALVAGYVTNMLGGDAVVTILPDGTISVEHPEN
jgi:hypothetical protein